MPSSDWLVYCYFDTDDMLRSVCVYYQDMPPVFVIERVGCGDTWTPTYQNADMCPVDVMDDVEFERDSVDALVSDLMYLLGGWDYRVECKAYPRAWV